MRDESGQEIRITTGDMGNLIQVDDEGRVIPSNIQFGLTVKVKRLCPEAVLPSYAKEGDAGMDLTAMSRRWDEVNRAWVYGTGLAFEIPDGYVGLLFCRSSVFKKDLTLCNAVGVADSKFRDEIKFIFKDLSGFGSNRYQVGDRIGQIIIMPFPHVTIEETSELSETDRGGGFGSSGA